MRYQFPTVGLIDTWRVMKFLLWITKAFSLNARKNVDISLLGALWQRPPWSLKTLTPFKTCKCKIDLTFRIPIDVAYPGARLSPLSRGNGISPWFEM